MRVCDPATARTMSPAPSPAGSAAPRAAKPAGDAPRAERATDPSQVSLSPRARLFAAAQQALGAASSERAARVQAIAQQVADGTFQIDLNRIAEALAPTGAQEE